MERSLFDFGEPEQEHAQGLLEAQIASARKRHPGMLLLFHLGDFYELFENDALLVQRELNLTLTHRDKLPMVGFPHTQLEQYLRKLLQAGHRVAICDPPEPTT